MKKFYKVALVIFGVISLVWFGLANPLNFFVQRSEHFSKRRFRSIEPGTSITAAEFLLGKPLSVVQVKSDVECIGCSIYYFMGDPPSWLLSYEEAWILVDSQGRVVQSIEHSEP